MPYLGAYIYDIARLSKGTQNKQIPRDKIVEGKRTTWKNPDKANMHHLSNLCLPNVWISIEKVRRGDRQT